MVSRVCDILDMQKNRNLPQLRPNLNNFRSGDMRINNSLIIDMSKLAIYQITILFPSPMSMGHRNSIVINSNIDATPGVIVYHREMKWHT